MTILAGAMFNIRKAAGRATATLVLITSLLASAILFANPVSAQFSCAFFPVGPALTDLDANEYRRLVSTDPLAYQPTGFIGGLYPGGSNRRPASHENAGVAVAGQIQPLDRNGNPSSSGKIGLTSIGMSNTQMEFATFMEMAHGDPQINDHLVLINGAAGGSVIERWVDPTDQFYTRTWDQLEDKIVAAGLTDAQMQVVWVKVTQFAYQPNFPQDMVAFQAKLEELARLLKAKFTNLKITYFSSRARSFAYHRGLSPEPTAFENGFAVRWMIERQINGVPSLNFDPARGPVFVSYLAWGPYLWIDGYNARSDGRIWPLTNTDPADCTHPTNAGRQAVAEMLMEFFTTDTTATLWFLDPGIPHPTPTLTRTPTPTSVDSPTPTPTRTPTPTPIPTRTPTPLSSPISTRPPADNPLPVYFPYIITARR